MCIYKKAAASEDTVQAWLLLLHGGLISYSMVLGISFHEKFSSFTVINSTIMNVLNLRDST
jgi:hypothetical protein